MYVLIAAVVRPALRRRTNEKFVAGASSQQFLVESVIGVPTLKAAAVEPHVQKQWDERLAAYVTATFKATMTAAAGQGLVQLTGKVTTALILFFGASRVMAGEMSIGELIAFNMIAAQLAAPIQRIARLWQDFQQIQISVDRLGDVLRQAPEVEPAQLVKLPRMKGDIRFRDVSFRYRTTPSGVIMAMPTGDASAMARNSASLCRRARSVASRAVMSSTSERRAGRPP